MADAKQVQIRRDTYTNLMSATPTEAELGFDQTNKRLIVGDGSTFGGIPHPNYVDVRNGVFNRGSVGGTANAITLTMTPPPISYQIGMELSFIATATNTTAATINVNGLGSRNIYKVLGSSVVITAAGDIVNGGAYKLYYDGTQFLLLNVAAAQAVTLIGQGQLKTSNGSVSFTTGSGPSFTSGSNVVRFGVESTVLPGGQYGFTPRVERDGSIGLAGFIMASTGDNVSSISGFGISASGAPSGDASQRYVTSSPPYDLGDGEAAGFFFMLINGEGEMVGHYAADTPPWAYNGPTDIRCTYVCPISGKKYRRALKKRTFEQYMDGAKITYENQEITQEIKNADMNLIPSPFLNHDKAYKTVLLDPMDTKIRKIMDIQNAGGVDEFLAELKAGKFQIDNDECKRCGPKGVHIHKMKYKYSKKF